MAVSAPFFASPPAATTSHQSPSLSFYPPSFPRRIFTPLSSSSSLPSFRVNSAVSHSVSSTTAIKSDSPSKTLPFRVGHGFDLHRLEPGYPLIIGGISIPHDRGCEAHSDGIFLWFLFLFCVFVRCYLILGVQILSQFCCWLIIPSI